VRPRLAHLREETGIAAVVAMSVMMVMLLLSAVVLQATLQLSGASNADTARKRAFEAADAGLQATLYRLNMLAPAPSLCIGGPAETVLAPVSSTTCDPYTEALGNGATFKTWTSPVFSGVGTCAGVQVGTSATVAERCITSVGTVSGSTRRLQTRVAAFAAAPVFPAAGLVGLHSVTLGNNATVNGVEGSNGLISLSNNATASSTTLGPSAPNPALSNHASAGVVTRRSQTQGPFVLSPVNPGNSATVSDDVRLTNALAAPRVAPFDSINGGVSWNANTRSLTLNNNASVTLGGALYNFCSLTLSNNSTITLAAGARTAIYIDSPDRPGSGCAAGTGSLTMLNNSSFVNNSPPAQGSSFLHDSTALQMYVYGRNDGTNVVTMRNNSDFYGTLYAPQSTVNLSNNANSYGAVAANNVNLSNNATYNGDSNATSISTQAGSLFFRTAWHECLPAATSPTDPQSGC
jgi:Tfp pilus assembly protein PilX